MRLSLSLPHLVKLIYVRVSRLEAKEILNFRARVWQFGAMEPRFVLLFFDMPASCLCPMLGKDRRP